MQNQCFDRSTGFFQRYFFHFYLPGVREIFAVTIFFSARLIFSLPPYTPLPETGQDPDVTVRLRRKFGGPDANSFQWHFRYMGAAEPDVHCPTIIRKSIDSLIYSNNMMEFVKTLGLR